MAFLRKLLQGSAKKAKEYPNIRKEIDPLEYWNKIGELGDGAFGKVYKVGGLYNRRYYREREGAVINKSKHFGTVSWDGSKKRKKTGAIKHIDKPRCSKTTKPNKQKKIYAFANLCKGKTLFMAAILVRHYFSLRVTPTPPPPPHTHTYNDPHHLGPAQAVRKASCT